MKTTGELRKHLLGKIEAIDGNDAEAINSITLLVGTINASIGTELRSIEVNKSGGLQAVDFGKLSLE